MVIIGSANYPSVPPDQLIFLYQIYFHFRFYYFCTLDPINVITAVTFFQSQSNIDNDDVILMHMIFRYYSFIIKNLMFLAIAH